MPISNAIASQLENASWIRRMFEESARLKRERGADAIFDFTLRRNLPETQHEANLVSFSIGRDR